MKENKDISDIYLTKNEQNAVIIFNSEEMPIRVAVQGGTIPVFPCYTTLPKCTNCQGFGHISCSCMN
jgi:hypothetical protein